MKDYKQYIKNGGINFRVEHIFKGRGRDLDSSITITCSHKAYFMFNGKVYTDDSITTELDPLELAFLKHKLNHFQREKIEDLYVLSEVIDKID